MEVAFESMDVAYEAAFSAPSFDLPGCNTAVLKSFYESINPRYPIRPADMQVSGGNLLSDVRVRVTMFNGNGVIDVTVDNLSIIFRSLRSKADLAVCKDCISLSEQAVRTSLPDLAVRSVALKPILFLRLGAGKESASSHLIRVVGSNLQADLSEFGNTTQHPGVNLELENTEEGWNAIFHAFRDRTRESTLVVSCQALYSEDGAIRGLEDRASHLQRLITAFLRRLGLETPDSPQEAT